ncbi:MAG: hypothetical protein KDC54_04080, partial [Lewinella sp.]|nr:hypothetical protein [Lewinella sp.]
MIRTTLPTHLLITALLLWSGWLAAQVSITTMVTPPVPITLAQIEQAEDELVLFNIMNPTDEPIDVQLSLLIENIDRPGYSTTTNGPAGQCLTLEPQMLNMFSLADLRSAFQSSDFEFGMDLESQLLLNPELAEGTYRFCIQVFACNDPAQPLTSTEEGCAMFMVPIADAPRVINPCEQGFVFRDADQLQISWSFITSPGFDGELTYTVQVAPIYPDDRPPQEALEAGGGLPIFEEEITDPMMQTLLIDLPDDIDFGEDYDRYAVRVIAAAPDGDMLIRNEGQSEVCVFEVRDPELPSEGFVLHYPEDGDFIPFSHFPLVVRFLPREEDNNWNSTSHRRRYGQFEASLNLTGPIPPVNLPRLIRWNSGPQASQYYLITHDPCNESLLEPYFTPERAQHLGFNIPQQELPGGRFPRHAETFQWTSPLFIRDYEGQRTFMTGSVAGAFGVGMKPSELHEPADEAVLPPGDVSFQWLTARAPDKLVPDYYLYQIDALSEDPNCHRFNGTVFERWELQVSQDADFNEILNTISSTVGEQRELRSLFDDSGQADAAAISEFKDALYKVVNQTLPFLNPGTYYWRVVWKTNPDEADDATFYQASEVWSFTIGAPEEEEAPPPDNCA